MLLYIAKSINRYLVTFNIKRYQFILLALNFNQKLIYEN